MKLIIFDTDADSEDAVSAIVAAFARITEASDTRTTEAGDTRVTEDAP